MTSKKISPVFYALANRYFDDVSLFDETNPKKFKETVKKKLFAHVNKSVEDYFRELPFLYFSVIDIDDNDLINFKKNIKDFLLTRRIKKVRCRKLEDIEGLLIPRKDEFSVVIKKIHPIRMLTSLAHEVGHTYLYNISNDPPTPLGSKSALKSKEVYDDWERLAYDVGRVLLLPEKPFVSLIRKSYESPSLENFFRMYDELKVSKDVLAIRLFRDLKLWDAYLFWGYLKNGAIIIENKDKFRIQEGKFKYFNLREAIRDKCLKIIIPDDKKNKENSLKKTIEKMNKIKGKNVKCKSRNFPKDCKIDIGGYKKSDGKILFTALLY